MTRFSPDSDILDSMIHAIYRYKTGEVDDDGNSVYRPIVFQTDAEDVTLKYEDFELTSFDVSDPAASKAAFANAVRNFDANMSSDVAQGKMDLYQLLQRVVDAFHVTSKMAVNTYDIPTKLSQFENDAGFVTAQGTVDKASKATGDEDGNNIKATYATKQEVLDKVPKSVGSNQKFIYSNADGVLTASTFEIWVSDT